MDAKLGNCLYDMLKNDQMTDITIVVQETAIKAHRVVVSSRGGFLKKLLVDEERVRFELKEDISVDIFKKVLEFIYTDSCYINGNNLFQVLHAAKVLDLKHLERFCGELVKPKMTTTNHGAFISHALKLGTEEIVKVCVEFFKDNTIEIIKKREFKDISHDALLMLCDSDRIACSEVDLFTACVEWAQQWRKQKATPENLRTTLGDVLMKIRFPVMTREDFATKVVPLDILTFEEIGMLCKQIETGKVLSNFKADMRTVPQEVEVIVRDFINRYPCVQKILPITATILQVKQSVSFKGTSYSGMTAIDSFTLSCNGKVLEDAQTLASFPKPIFDIHSFVVDLTTVYNRSKKTFPVSLKTSEMADFERIIRGNIYSHTGTGFATERIQLLITDISGRRTQFHEGLLCPGIKLTYIAP